MTVKGSCMSLLKVSRNAIYNKVWSLFMQLVAVMTHVDSLAGQTRRAQLSTLKAGNTEELSFAACHCLACGCNRLVSAPSSYRMLKLHPAQMSSVAFLTEMAFEIPEI